MSRTLTRDMMHDYQNKVVEFIKENPYCALWLDMGLGKTVSTSTAINDLFRSADVGRVLVVAPKRVALTTWPIEFGVWKHLRWIRHQVITGNEKQRVRAIMTRADVHIINRENLAWLVRVVGKQWPWDMVVLDESSSFKSASSNRWEAMRMARRVCDRVVELSATPAPQGLVDLWAQFYLLDQGHRLGNTEKAFKTRWFIEDRDAYRTIPRDHAEEEIHSLVSDITISMAAEDYLDMPELIQNPVMVKMPAKAMQRYKEFEKELILELAEVDAELEADNAAILVNKLLQFANGAVYYTDQRDFTVLHDEKIEALKELVEAHEGYPLLVAYSYKSDLVRLKKAFPQAVEMDDDPETTHRWNRGEIPMLLTHPASSGHGLNLQRGSNIIVWFGLNWSLEYYLQLIGRLYRQGQQKETVVVHHLLSEGTADERVFRVLKQKKATQQSLLDAVRVEK